MLSFEDDSRVAHSNLVVSDVIVSRSRSEIEIIFFLSK